MSSDERRSRRGKKWDGESGRDQDMSQASMRGKSKSEGQAGDSMEE
jgi:hypothetical protein